MEVEKGTQSYTSFLGEHYNNSNNNIITIDNDNTHNETTAV